MLDLIIQNALLLDMCSGHAYPGLLGVRHGRIELVGPENSSVPEARNVVDANGAYLFPGFVDFHTHLFRHGSSFGMDANDLISGGITAAADMGSAGWVNFPAMYCCDMAGKQPRLRAFLNISPIGQPGKGINEPLDSSAIAPGEIERILRNYPRAIAGLKVRVSRGIVKNLGLSPLKEAISLGESFGLPVCVHTTDPPESADRIAALLRSGDIYSHAYHGKGHHSAENSSTLSGMLAAKKRGVLSEVGNGLVNFNFDVAERCLEAGLTPDIISSDATPKTWHRDPAMWDLARVVSKFLNMGMALKDAVRAVTETPARVLGLDQSIGKLAEGYAADLALFRWDSGMITFCDSDGNERRGPRGLVPMMTLINGQVVWKQE